MTWQEAVNNMANWYQNNIHTYQGTVSKPRNLALSLHSCPLLGGTKVRDDCTGFVSACCQLIGAVPRGYLLGSADCANPRGTFAKHASKGGFKVMKYSDEALLPYDIAACYIEGGTHHAEIFAGRINGKKKSFSWGNIHDKAHGGMPSYCCINRNYQVIYRHDGVSRDLPAGFSLDSGSYNSGVSGGGTFIINFDNYIEPYPVHSEYETYTGGGGNIFSNAQDNAFAMAAIDSSLFTNKADQKIIDSSTKQVHTRIYSTNDATIILDELKIPLDVSNGMTWANKGIDQNAVDKWQKDQDKQKEEAKKKQEETNQNPSTNQNSSTNQNPSTNQNSSTKQN